MRLCGYLAFAVLLLPLRSFSEEFAQPDQPECPKYEGGEAAAKVNIIYTGFTKGISTTSSQINSLVLLLDYFKARRGYFGIKGSGIGVLHHEGNYIFHEQKISPIEEIAEFLKQPDLKREVVVEKIKVLDGDFELCFQYPHVEEPDLVQLMLGENEQLRRFPDIEIKYATLAKYSDTFGRSFLVLETRGPGEGLEKNVLKWQFEYMLVGDVKIGNVDTSIFAFSKSYKDGPRRTLLIEKIAREYGRENSLLVDAGNAVEGVDFLTGKVSQCRELSFLTLGRLDYDALLPAELELYEGLENLKSMARKYELDYIATNLYYSKGEMAGKSVFRRYLVKQVNGLRVGFIGLIDSRIPEKISDPLKLKDVEFRDEVSEAIDAVYEMKSSPAGKPHVVVVLTNSEGERLSRILSEVYDIDIVIGDFSRAGSYIPKEDYSVGESQRNRERIWLKSAFLAARAKGSRVGMISLTCRQADRDLLVDRAEHRQFLVASDLPADEALQEKVMESQLDALRGTNEVLIPAIDEIIGSNRELEEYIWKTEDLYDYLPQEERKMFPPRFSDTIWSNVVANILRKKSSSEVAILRKLERRGDMVGDIPKAMVLTWLTTEEKVRVYYLTGKELKALKDLETASSKSGERLFISGYIPEQGLVGGRKIAEAELYSVATTDALAEFPAYRKIFSGKHYEDLFVWEDDHLYEAKRKDDGVNVTLRELVLRELETLKAQAGGDFGSEYNSWFSALLEPAGRKREPRLLLRFDGLTFTFQNYANSLSDSYVQYSRVRETRATLPDNQSIGGKGDVSVLYDTEDIAWESRLKADYSRTLFKPSGQKIVQEMADDVVGSTEFRLNFMELGMKRTKMKVVSAPRP